VLPRRFDLLATDGYPDWAIYGGGYAYRSDRTHLTARRLADPGASADERAQRRALESGGDVQEIADSIRSRDRKDSERAVAPLAEADGAIVVDTTGRPVEDVLEELLGLLGVNP